MGKLGLNKLDKDIFIFTEVVRCGKIGSIALASFFKYHPQAVVHVYGLKSDQVWIKPFPQAIFHAINASFAQDPHYWLRRKSIVADFDRGHRGTGGLWSHIIQTRPERYFIHFDSDTIFRAPSLPDITSRLAEGYGLVGMVRNYRYNPNKMERLRFLPDVVQTCFFGFDKKLITPYSYQQFTLMCCGGYNPAGYPVIDFFDPVSFNIITNGGKVGFLPPEDYGGQGFDGKRQLTTPDGILNTLIDYGNKFIHFSAVGSGLNYVNNPKKITGVSLSYISYALERYAVYAKIFYQEDIGIPIDEKKYAPLFKIANWY